ncbi:hypothetical protein K438DRAFT_1925081 [Mycena galopus ATCC 62051]|nr:hypothetical protein K438DRAFT_1925081 [Mycena galopus ATCC 62051]
MECVTYSYGPFTSVLPNSTERAQLQTVLRSGQSLIDYRPQAAKAQILEEYDEEIEKLQSILNRMVADRTVLQYHADACLSAASPIRRLPNEILLQIFKFSPFRPPTYENEWDGQPDTGRIGSLGHLLRLAEVCASWRRLVMGTPALWRKIEMDFDELWTEEEISGEDIADESADCLERMLQLARSALERSVVVPLQICIRDLAGGPVVQLLVRSSHRWQEAMIWTNYHGQHHAYTCSQLAVAKGNLPLLERLHISGLPDGADFFEFAPRLTNLSLENPIPQDPKLPWGQLRSLSYTGLSTPDDFDNLTSQLPLCPQITNLSFHGLCLDWTYDLPALVSDVRSLAIGFLPDAAVIEESPTVISFLACITLRRARSLLLETDSGQNPVRWSQTAFLAFAARSSLRDTLQALEISNIAISAEQLLECLSHLPCIEVLSVADPSPTRYNYAKQYGYTEILALFPINDALLRGLTWAADSDPLVPRLHSFECKTFMQFEGISYLDFVSSRVGPGRTADGPFQSSILYYRRTAVEPLLVERLSEFVLQKVLKSRLERDHLGSFWPGDHDPDNLSRARIMISPQSRWMLGEDSD